MPSLAAAEKFAQSSQFIGKDAEMINRCLFVVAFALIAYGCVAPARAEIIRDFFAGVFDDTRDRNQWPCPYYCPDREVARSPFCIMTTNGWRKQNMLGDCHFQVGTGQLTEAGRLKVRWILTVCQPQHRMIYVHLAESREETNARLAAVHKLMDHLTPEDPAPVMTTAIPDDGWSADQVDIIRRKYQSTTPEPRLPWGGDNTDTPAK